MNGKIFIQPLSIHSGKPSSFWCFAGLLLASAALILAMACGGGGGGGGNTITNAAPLITTQPASQTVNAGGTASFTVAASGTPAPTFTWQRSNDGGTTWTAISGATSATYTFTAAKADHNAQFRATASNTVSPDATSTAATLSVQWLAITTQPGDKSVVEGSPATFTVVADANPAATLQWQSSTDGTTWTNVAGATAASYTTGATSLSSSGTRFRCVLTNATGSINSNSATLTVTALVVAPAITTQPASATVTAGSPASFTVVATGTAPLRYQWMKGAANVGTDSATYTIASATASDAGSYTVTVSNGFGSPVTSSAATLTVVDAPVITSFVAAKSIVTLGTGTTLTAVFTGGVTATVDNGIGPVASGVAVPTGNLMANTTFTLTVTNAAGTPVTQSVTVNVVATATQPVVTAPANVTASQAGYIASIVSQAGSTYDWSLSGGTITSGQGTASIIWTAPASGTVTLTCTVTNAAGDSALPGTATSTVVPTPSITSFTNGGLQADGTGTTLQATFVGGDGLVTPGDLPITSGAGLPLAGALTSNTTYTLTVTNPAGTSVRAATTVAVLPVFTTQPAPLVLVPTSTATFTAVVSSASPITAFTWERSNDSGTTWTLVNTGTPPSSPYTTPVLAASDNGALFRAIATNAHGSAISMAAGLNQALNVVAGSTSIDLVMVPAGSFTMGETDTAPVIVSSNPAALTAHAVTIGKAFYVAKVPCTQAQWLAIMGINPSSFTTDDVPSSGDHLTRPVEMVSFDDITTPTTGFLAQLNAATAGTRPPGSVFRLPTEAEYEYAFRAGSTGQNNYYFGSYDSGSINSTVLDLIDTYLWSSRNSASPAYPLGSTRPVGMRLPNAWGLHDMAGNVWQVCQDDWHDSYDATGTGVPTLPVDGTAWVDSPRAARRVFRGGSWQHNSHYGQSKSRGRDLPNSRDFTLGFRVVLEVP